MALAGAKRVGFDGAKSLRKSDVRSRRQVLVWKMEHQIVEKRPVDDGEDAIVQLPRQVDASNPRSDGWCKSCDLDVF